MRELCARELLGQLCVRELCVRKCVCVREWRGDGGREIV